MKDRLTALFSVTIGSMDDSSLPSQLRAAERRVHPRHALLLPIEVCVWDGSAQKELSQWVHAVMLDASAGGMRLELLGPAAHLIGDPQRDAVLLKLRFLCAPLKDTGDVCCTVRWQRSKGDRLAIGLQFCDMPSQHAVAIMTALVQSQPRQFLGRLPFAGPVAAVATLLLLLYTAYLQQQNTELTAQGYSNSSALRAAELTVAQLRATVGSNQSTMNDLVAHVQHCNNMVQLIAHMPESDSDENADADADADAE